MYIKLTLPLTCDPLARGELNKESSTGTSQTKEDANNCALTASHVSKERTELILLAISLTRLSDK